MMARKAERTPWIMHMVYDRRDVNEPLDNTDRNEFEAFFHVLRLTALRL